VGIYLLRSGMMGGFGRRAQNAAEPWGTNLVQSVESSHGDSRGHFQSSTLSIDAPEGCLGLLSLKAAAEGGTGEESFEDVFDGQTASGRTFKFASGPTATWYVPRVDALVTTISCRVEGAANARDACRPVLSKMKLPPLEGS
jgi:hypothetical protein